MLGNNTDSTINEVDLNCSSIDEVILFTPIYIIPIKY